jgi:hypothetical protein
MNPYVEEIVAITSHRDIFKGRSVEKVSLTSDGNIHGIMQDAIRI